MRLLYDVRGYDGNGRERWNRHSLDSILLLNCALQRRRNGFRFFTSVARKRQSCRLHSIPVATSTSLPTLGLTKQRKICATMDWLSPTFPLCWKAGYTKRFLSWNILDPLLHLDLPVRETAWYRFWKTGFGRPKRMTATVSNDLSGGGVLFEGLTMTLRSSDLKGDILRGGMG